MTNNLIEKVMIYLIENRETCLNSVKINKLKMKILKVYLNQ